jgi:photosystem II stability/assembly factor-like uncharacterized protein
MAIALTHGGTTVYTTPSRSNEVLIGTREGVMIIGRTDGGTGWSLVHHALPEHHISSIIEEPASGLLFAGAFGDGSVHASADAGRTWELRDNGLTLKDVYTVAAGRVNGTVRVFAGVEPASLFYSDDLGLNWAELPNLRSVPSVDDWYFPGPPHIGHLKQLSVDPADPKTLYASIEVGALLKSTDGGQTWQELFTGDKDTHRTVLHPAKPDRVFCVCGGGGSSPNPGVFLSEDRGESWEQLTGTDHPIGDYPDLLVAHPQDPDLLFISAAHHSPGDWRTSHYAGSRISRSADGGRTWDIISGGLPDRLQASIEAMILEAYGDSFSLFAATTSGDVWNSDDGGENWSMIVDGLPPVSKKGHYVPLAVPA